MNKKNKIQNCIFKILCDIDDYCKKNKIKYFLSGGTCLGAIRHSGFIPWDDDGDIMIPRYDFDRFIYGFAKKYQNVYGVGSLKYDLDWKIPFGRVWDLSTIAYYKNLEMKKMGVFVDIFPIDGLPNNKVLQQLTFLKIKKYNILRHASMRIKFRKEEKWKTIKSVLSFFCKKRGARYYALLMENEVLKYDYNKAEEVAVSMACHYGNKEIINKNCMFKAVLKMFNGKKFPVPVGYDRYLKNLYGNYMLIPKKIEKRKHSMHWEIKV